MKKSILYLILVGLLTMFVAACDETGTEGPAVESLMIVDDSGTDIGDTYGTALVSATSDTLQLSVEFMPEGSTGMVIWASDNAALTVDSDGLVTAVSANAATTITATLEGDAQISDTVIIESQ